MPKRFLSLILFPALTLLFLTACDQSAPNAPVTQTSGSATAPTADATPAPPMHEHHPPHHGTLVELGEEFSHLELVLDAKTGTLTGYALDGEAEQSVRLKQPGIAIQITGTTAADGTERTLDKPVIVTLQGVADPLSGETVGDTSEFNAQADILKDITGFKGSVTDITIKGAEFKDVAFGYPEGNDPHAAKK